jgi:zinc/manganese transport system ATP-binding protein
VTGPDADEVLALEGVGVRLAGRQVLSDVTFSVRSGEFTGVIGSNGAGKTTMFRVILGLESPGAGHVRFGQAGKESPEKKRRPAIGYVPQKVSLERDLPLRARDLVGLGVDGNKLGLPLRSKARQQAVDEMLEAVGATSFADSRVGTLSGGEQQRVLIAHALVSKPRLLILDEPLSNLDLGSGQEIVELLGELVRRQGVAVLMAAHDINPLLPVMDRVVYIASGRAASGTAEEVVRPDVLTALYGYPVSVLNAEGRILVIAGADVQPVGTLEDDLGTHGHGEGGR